MKRIISVLLVLVWMIVIFVMSSFDSVESTNQSNIIVDFIVNLFDITNVDIITSIVRKTAHFMEYAILGLLVANMIKCYDIDNRIYVGIIVCILYAVSDEVHQMFVPGRSCQLYDVFIDGMGSLVGIFLFNKLKKIKFLYRNL